MKEKVVFGAYDLFMRYGIKSVSMDDIAKHLGMSKKTIYQHVENKDDLVNKVVSAAIKHEEKMIQEIVESASDAIEGMRGLAIHVNTFLTRMKPSLMYDLQKYHRETWQLIHMDHFEFIHQVIRNNMIRGKKEELYRPEISEDLISIFFTQAAMATSNEDVFPSAEYKKQELFMEHLIYHMYGIVNEKGKNIIQNRLIKTLK